MKLLKRKMFYRKNKYEIKGENLWNMNFIMLYARYANKNI